MLDPTPEHSAPLSHSAGWCVPNPMTNTTTHHTTYLDHRKVVALESVKTVYSAAIWNKDNKSTSDPIDSTECIFHKTVSTVQPVSQSGRKQGERPKTWDLPVELSHLPEEHQRMVETMLREECQVFAFDSNDVGYIPYQGSRTCWMHWVEAHDFRCWT